MYSKLLFICLLNERTLQLEEELLDLDGEQTKELTAPQSAPQSPAARSDDAPLNESEEWPRSLQVNYRK